MKRMEWLKPGMGIKRWIFMGIIGILFFSIGIGQLFDLTDRASRVFFIFLGVLFIFGGALSVYIAFRYGFQSLFSLLSSTSTGMSGLDAAKLSQLALERRILGKGPKIVVIGGGTGLSVLLRGLKHYTSNITAVVTVADDGGGSGQLRQDMGIIPPGDIRNCILALANMEPIMEKLLQYRFKEGALKGQSFGNLLIAAMSDISNGFEEGIRQISNVLAVTGRVLPVTLENVSLCAKLEDGSEIIGESKIPVVQKEKGSKIDSVYMRPKHARALPEVLEAISDADAILLGPGSLYTSIIPNLLVEGVADTVRKSNAVKIYISNVMTQPGETQGYSVSDHICAIQKHAGDGLVQYALVNNNFRIPRILMTKYQEDGAEPVRYSMKRIYDAGIQLVEKDMLKISGELIRHGSKPLAEAVIELLSASKPITERSGFIGYDSVKGRIKKGYRSLYKN